MATISQVKDLNGTTHDIGAKYDVDGNEIGSVYAKKADISDTKVTNTLANATKFYVTGTTSGSTNTGTQNFDSGVYVTETAGELNATQYKVSEAATIKWNATNQCIDFVFE